MIKHQPYTSPSFDADAFNCPICNAYAKQTWEHAMFGPTSFTDYRFSKCSRCGCTAIWCDRNEQLVHPQIINSPQPNEDLPQEIKEDFEEARLIHQQSSRGCCAILRLCIQKLCIHLGGAGKSINDDIALLVKNGLPPKVQQALDVVRVVGNNAVHPGELDIKDKPDVAEKLFRLVNVIADTMITQPNEVNEIFVETIPQKGRDAISKRDGSP